MIKVPANAQILKVKSSIVWLENGILCIIYKPVKNAAVPIQEIMLQIKEKVNDEKVCVLIDVTNVRESTRESRNLAYQEFPKFVKAIAFVSDTALGEMIANVFSTLRNDDYPMRFFDKEEEAKAWLRKINLRIKEQDGLQKNI